jgi:DNA-binding response OmpR family regulator
MTQSRRILLVSESEQIIQARFELEQSGLAVTLANDYEAAFAVLIEEPFDLVIADSGPVERTVEFIKRVRATPRLADILILILAEWGRGEATLALSAGADGYEPKGKGPFDPNRLITSIERLPDRRVTAAN